MEPLRLHVSQLSKSFYDVPAIDAVDVEIIGGEVHGLLGENGAGKSTLCSVLAGLYRPDDGRITLDGVELALRSPQDAARAGIGMVYQHFRLVDSFNVAENIVLGQRRAAGRRRRRDVARRVERLAADYGLEVEPSALVWQLSVGERQHVEILKQLFRGARVLILDEPTAVLAPHEADHLFTAVGHMSAQGHAIVLVSHKMDEILGHTDRVTVLRRGRNAGGGATSGLTPSDLASMMFGGAVLGDEEAATVTTPGAAVLDVAGLHVLGDHGRTAVDDVSLTVRRGEIVGIAGVAGNGQRELHEAIAGLRRSQAGSITVDGVACAAVGPAARNRAGLAYVPEDRLGTGLASGLPLEDNLILKNHDRRPQSRHGVLSPAAIRRHADELTRDFDVRGARPGMPVSFMSGGNLQKAILARELSEHHEVLVAAAPTRGLDIAAAHAVRQHLRRERDHGRGVLLFSEDLTEVLDLADTILVMYRGRLVGCFDTRVAAPDVEQIGLLMTGATEMAS